MREPSTKTEHVSHAELIVLLRDQLARLTDEENSICKVASEKGMIVILGDLESSFRSARKD